MRMTVHEKSSYKQIGKPDIRVVRLRVDPSLGAPIETLSFALPPDADEPALGDGYKVTFTRVAV